MASTDDLIQNVIETIDNASSQRLHLSELLDCLQEAKQQVWKAKQNNFVFPVSSYEKTWKLN